MPSQITTTSVNLLPEQLAAVDALAKDRGYMSRSEAMRQIIREWLHVQRIRHAADRVLVDSHEEYLPQ